jgi:hypothetical protein
VMRDGARIAHEEPLLEEGGAGTDEDVEQQQHVDSSVDGVEGRCAGGPHDTFEAEHHRQRQEREAHLVHIGLECRLRT